MGRTIVPFDGELILTIPSEELDLAPDRPLLTKHGLFIWDNVGNHVKLIDVNTKQIIRTYGKGSGRGPGEYQWIFNFDANDEVIGLVDIKLRRVSLFDIASGELISTTPIKTDPYKMFLLDNDHFVVHALGADSLLSLFGTESEVELASASVLNLKVASNYMLSMYGHYVSRDREKEVLYFPTREARVFAFEVEGDELRRGKIYPTLDTNRFIPTVQKTETGGFMAIAPTSEVTRTGTDFTGDKFVSSVYSLDTAKNEYRFFVLDVYDSELSYVKSYDILGLVPKSVPQRVTAHDDVYCYMDLETVRCYRMPGW